MQHGSVLQTDGSNRRARARLAVTLAVVLVAGCGRGSRAGQDAGEIVQKGKTSPELLNESERLLASRDENTTTRQVLLDFAERVGTRAVSEGSTAVAATLATAAGSLSLRAYRLGRELGDAQRAINWWTVASSRVDLAEACPPARAKAELIGELARDPAVTYRELVAERKRFEGRSCALDFDAAVDRLAPFRPTAAALPSLDVVASAGSSISANPNVNPPTVAHVTSFQRWTTTDSARVVLTLDQPVSYTVEPADAETFRLHIEPVILDGIAATSLPAGKGLLRFGTLGRGVGSSAELSLMFTRPAYRRVFFLPDPFRLVVDLSTKPPAGAVGTGPRPLRRVVIDAGHGGVDPGAVGPTGVFEKDITLAIAQEIAPIVARELSAEVRLTRATDTFVSLEERAAVANAFEADLFLSIHCNSAGESGRSRRGTETYILDTARDELATRVARRENGGGHAGPSTLRAILDDLKISELGGRSRHFADLLQKSVVSSLHTGGFSDIVDGGVHGAGFFVLVGARMPAALIEVAFISNPAEEALLNKQNFRGLVADGILNALRAYRDGR